MNPVVLPSDSSARIGGETRSESRQKQKRSLSRRATTKAPPPQTHTTLAHRATSRGFLTSRWVNPTHRTDRTRKTVMRHGAICQKNDQKQSTTGVLVNAKIHTKNVLTGSSLVADLYSIPMDLPELRAPYSPQGVSPPPERHVPVHYSYGTL